MFEASKDPWTFWIDAKTSPWVCSRASSRSSNKQYDQRPWTNQKRDYYCTKQDYLQSTGKKAELERKPVPKQVKDLLTDAVHSHQYRLINKSAWYNDDVAFKVDHITERVIVIMKDRSICGGEDLSFMTFLQDFETAYDTCNIHKGAVSWLCKQFFTGPDLSVINAR